MKQPEVYRNAELAKIHLAKKQLGLTDDEYRDILWAEARVKSARDLTAIARHRLLKHFEALGFKPRHKNPDALKRPPLSRPLADSDQSKMIRALWLELADLGAARDASEKALASFVARMTRVDALQWLSIDQASKVIEALKAWRDRARVERFRGWLIRTYPGQALPDDLASALEKYVVRRDHREPILDFEAIQVYGDAGHYILVGYYGRFDPGAKARR